MAIRFGLSLEPRVRDLFGPIDVPVGPGRIILFSGPSGTGKSTALSAIAAERKNAVDVGSTRLPDGTALVDTVAPGRPLDAALRLLTACGLGEAGLWLQPCHSLSEGERFRARLARAVGAVSDRQHSDRDLANGEGLDRDASVSLESPSGTAPTNVLIIDEFCSGLHRRCAQALAYNVRRLATQRGLCAIVAAADDDLVSDLQPDTLVRLGVQPARAVIEARRVRPRGISLARRLSVRPGSLDDYAVFAQMHYRGGSTPALVDKVFVLRHRASRELLGVVVYGYGPMELALRNSATGGAFVRNPQRLNREVRILRRLVIHPDVRGCGLAQLLVRRTLPLVGTPLVECLATMGHVNPVFEKAGMARIGVCPPPARLASVLARLRELRADPLAIDFVDQVCRAPAVRQVVTATVAAWYRATTGAGDARAARKSPQRLVQLFRGLVAAPPVYYLWRRDVPAKHTDDYTSPQTCRASSDGERDSLPPPVRAARRGAPPGPACHAQSRHDVITESRSGDLR